MIIECIPCSIVPSVNIRFQKLIEKSQVVVCSQLRKTRSIASPNCKAQNMFWKLGINFLISTNMPRTHPILCFGSMHLISHSIALNSSRSMDVVMLCKWCKRRPGFGSRQQILGYKSFSLAPHNSLSSHTQSDVVISRFPPSVLLIECDHASYWLFKCILSMFWSGINHALDAPCFLLACHVTASADVVQPPNDRVSWINILRSWEDAIHRFGPKWTALRSVRVPLAQPQLRSYVDPYHHPPLVVRSNRTSTQSMTTNPVFVLPPRLI